MLAIIELGVFGAALCLRGDVSHFTWWGVAMMCFWDVLSLTLSPSKDAAVLHRAGRAFLVVSALILAAVLAMSCLGCDMLGAALDDVGPWVYIMGNFALHYYPSLRAIKLEHSRRLERAPSPRPEGEVTGDAALLLAAYCVLNDPTLVYGCAMLADWAVAPAGVAGALLLDRVVANGI